MKTHKKIVDAIWTLADYEPLSVSCPFRGYDVVRMDGCDIQAYKVGHNNNNPLIVQWEDLTPVEALRLKRASRYTLERQLLEANERLAALEKVQEIFEKSPFGCR